MPQEIEDVFTLAINCLVAAIVIAFIVLGISARNQMAQARNEQLVQQERYSQAAQYNGYDTSIITGDEVITLIREFYSHEDLEIYLDNDKYGNELYITTQLSRQDPNLVKIETLRNRLDLTKTADGKKYNTLYQVYLVYDAMDIKEVVDKQVAEGYSIVSGIKIVKRNGDGK